jgi:hypothetical protein
MVRDSGAEINIPERFRDDGKKKKNELCKKGTVPLRFLAGKQGRSLSLQGTALAG